MPFVVGEQVGSYRIVEQLGQGGMSTVYKAYHAALDRYVALKVLHPVFKGDRNFLVRFQREARIVARLEHPNIVPVYDFSEHEGTPYLVMRFVEGHTLKAVLIDAGGLPLGQVVAILRPVCEALEYAHGQGVLHRDVKPSNVLLSQGGKIYVTDFGLAKMVHSGDSTISHDRMIGTPHYISPEQAKGESLDYRTDLYSLGVILFEMVTGRVPYTADTPFAVVHDHIFSPLPLPSLLNPDVPPAVEQVVLKALAKAPGDRYQGAGDLLRALVRVTDELRVEVPPPVESGVRPVPAVPAPTAVSVSPAAEDAGISPVLTPLPAAADSDAVAAVPEPAADSGAVTPIPAAEQATGAAPVKRQGVSPWVFGIGGLVLGAILVVLAFFLLIRPAILRRAAQTGPTSPVPPVEGVPPDMEVFPVRTEEGYVRPGALPPEVAEERLELVEGAIEQDPENAWLLFERGNILYQVGRFDEAAEAYREAIARGSDMGGVHYNLGAVLLHLDRPHEALVEFEVVLDMYPDEVDPAVLYNTGLAHAMLGHRREAIVAFRNFLHRWPDEDLWRRRVLEILRHWGEED